MEYDEEMEEDNFEKKVKPIAEKTGKAIGRGIFGFGSALHGAYKATKKYYSMEEKEKRLKKQISIQKKRNKLLSLESKRDRLKNKYQPSPFSMIGGFGEEKQLHKKKGSKNKKKTNKRRRK